MPQKIINFNNPFLKKIVVIIIGLFCFASLHSNAQTMSSKDSLKAITKKQEAEKKKAQLLRKKERQRIQDSIALESKRAAAARKAYRKSLKKKSRKREKTSSPKKKEKPLKKTQRKEKNSSLKEKETHKRNAASEPAPIKTKKDSTNKEKEVVKRKAKPRKPIIYKDYYARPHFRVKNFIKEQPEKKKTYFAFQIGSSSYLGDLGGNSALENNILGDINFKENTFFYGFSLTHLRREVIGLRLSYVFGKLAGSDKNTYFKNTSDPSYSRFVRNLDFQTNINEGSLMLEVHPFKFLSYRTKLHNSYFQPYTLIGLGRYSFNPQGSYFDPILDEDVWVDLQPLSLEGQGMTEFPDRKVYSLSQWNIPYGFGFNYEISQTVSLGLEYVGRILFTDYLDDVSTTFINPSLFDNYLTPENAELAKILNNKSKNVDATRAYEPGQQRGSASNDFYFSLNARLIIKISKARNKKSVKKLFKYDDNEICE